MEKKSGMMYVPEGIYKPVCKKGNFRFSSIGLDHGHIYAMTSGLLNAGAELVKVWDKDLKKMEDYKEKFPEVKIAKSEDEVLNDASINMIISAAIPSERCDLGIKVLDHGKHYMSDKAPFTTLMQIEKAENKLKALDYKLKWSVCYSERLQNESAVQAGYLIKSGEIGKVIQVIGMGPHRLDASKRPGWFFNKEKYGGILCDIGSHQIEQFLYYTDSKDAKILHSKVGNYNHPEYPDFDDFGDATLVSNNGASNYFRVDWFTPDGLGVWGDGRTFILGTKGYIELRKYIDVALSNVGDNIYMVNDKREKKITVSGKIGFPYFGELILDCLENTDKALPHQHAFKAAELCILAQNMAIKIV